MNEPAGDPLPGDESPAASEAAAETPPAPGVETPPTESAPAEAAEEPLKLTRGQKIAFTLVYVVIGLLLGEGAVRALSDPPPHMFDEHPYLRHVRSQNVSHTWVSPIDGRSFAVATDEHGFRTKNLEPPGEPKPKGTYRIFFVGGSTTENIGLPDEETFPEIVQSKLNKRLGGTPLVRTINTGISGNTVVDSFSLISHRILTLEPDLIVVLHASNDMRQGLSDRFDPTHYGERKRHKKPRFSDWLQARSRLYDLGLRLKKATFSTRGAQRYKERRNSIPFSKNIDPSRRLAHFQRYLAMISAVCKDRGVPVVFMTQPSLYKAQNTTEEDAALWLGVINHGEINLDNATLLKGMQVFNAAIAEHAQARGNLLIDLEPVVPKDLEHFYDDAHYTSKASALIADTIVDALLKDGKLP